jgi:hypothetical protein
MRRPRAPLSLSPPKASAGAGPQGVGSLCDVRRSGSLFLCRHVIHPLPIGSWLFSRHALTEEDTKWIRLRRSPPATLTPSTWSACQTRSDSKRRFRPADKTMWAPARMTSAAGASASPFRPPDFPIPFFMWVTFMARADRSILSPPRNRCRCLCSCSESGWWPGGVSTARAGAPGARERCSSCQMPPDPGPTPNGTIGQESIRAS